MKILHFAHCFFPIYGGTTTRLYHLLADRINEHYLYIPQAPSRYIPDNIGVLKEKEAFRNIKVRRCKLVEDFKVKILVINTFRYITINSDRLVNFVKEEGIEIVHGHNPLVFATAAMKYAKRFDIPFVYEVHRFEADTHIVKRQYIPKVAYSSVRELFKLKEKKIFQSADAIITQTNAIEQRVINVFDVDADKITIIPLGVDEINFDPVNWHQKGKELRRERKWADKIIFMYNGYLEYITGIKFFINAVQELPDNIKREIKVVVLGRGPLQKYVEDMSKNESWLEYLGLVNYNDMPIYYSACDVLAIPMLSTITGGNNTPTKLLEAMVMEKIVLGSDVGGITEVVTNNKNGIIFKKENKDELLKKISYIVENIEKMDGIREQARKDIIEKYRYERSRGLLQNVYESVMK